MTMARPLQAFMTVQMPASVKLFGLIIGLYTFLK